MILKTQDLGYQIGNKKLLDNINLTFQAGQLYGISGPNGSGKSTLLKCLTGIWKPTQGKVLWKGDALHGWDKREISKTLSLVPQSPPLPFDFNVWDFVSMGRYPYQKSGQTKVCSKVIDWALTVVDAWHLKEQKVNCLCKREAESLHCKDSLNGIACHSFR